MKLNSAYHATCQLQVAPVTNKSFKARPRMVEICTPRSLRLFCELGIEICTTSTHTTHEGAMGFTTPVEAF